MGEAWIGLLLTRVTAIRADGSLELDTSLIPTVAGFGASELLMSWLFKIQDLARMRADVLASRLAGSDNSTASAATVSDYLLLQILNCYEPQLKHLLIVPSTSPADIYQLLLGLAWRANCRRICGRERAGRCLSRHHTCTVSRIRA